MTSAHALCVTSGVVASSASSPRAVGKPVRGAWDLDCEECGTTVMLRNIACCYTQDDVAAVLDGGGFEGKYDFIYMPRPSRSTTQKQSNFGYVFVNFTCPEFVRECAEVFSGRVFGGKGAKWCQVMPARIQGDVNLRRVFKKKSLKHRAMPLVVR